MESSSSKNFLSHAKVELKVRVRHNVLTQYIVDVNRKLSSFQRERIQQTPFKWMVQMEKVLDISNSLMKELLSRWASDNQTFRIRKSLVPFSVLDICFVLGLPVMGDEVKMENDGGG
ncbi:hypothetical protein VNO80_13500 [Phaseolus coccineus]|uniref:Uncharacterized protein n=1 Tax=Phaseolus coccineus TaxID=3886 RepID=A0AAN9RFP9_PHACN